MAGSTASCELAAIAAVLVGIGAGCGDERRATTAVAEPDAVGDVAAETGADADDVSATPEVIELASDAARVTVSLEPFGLTFADGQGQVVLRTLDATTTVPDDALGAYTPLGVTVRTQTIDPPIIEGWDHVSQSDAPWARFEHAALVRDATPTHVTLALFDTADAAPRVRVDITVEGASVVVDARVGDPAAAVPPNVLGMAFATDPGEGFFGLGERFVTVDHRRRRYDCWTEEGGVPAGEAAPPAPDNPAPHGANMAHLPVPLLLSSRGWGLWVDTTWRSTFALADQSESAFRIDVSAPRLRYRVFVRHALRDVLADYTAVTGRAALPAPWVFGPRRRVGPTSLVGDRLETELLRERHVPTTAVDDARHFLPIASETGHEEELAAWAAAMHARGFKVIGYYNAYVSVTDPRTVDLVAEARERGYFVKMLDGSELDTPMISSGPQTVATIDMSNPEAVTWYQSILQRALDLGYDGWMLDFGEYLPPDALLFDQRTGFEAHNDFPLMYQRATWDYMRRVRGDDFLYFARAGYSGTQALTPVVWSGDPATSFDDAKGLPAQVRGGINAGLSGLPFWGSDISGYTCLGDPPADKEVYLRWAAFGALSSDMHDENACAAAPSGAGSKWTLWSDEETTAVYGDYARLHTRLFPYIYAAAKEATETGMPVMRHPLLVHPDSAKAAAVELEYYFGPSLYVAPVVRRGATTRSLWLPPGRWVDWWTLAPLTSKGEGDVVTRDAPLALIPLYLRSGGVVALLDPAVETLAPDDREDVTSLADVAGIYDVRAAIDRATGSGLATLVDGTRLEVALGAGAVSLPEDVAVAADEAELATCARCGRIDALEGGAVRVRFTRSSAVGAETQLGGLTLRHGGGPAARVRWDVVVIDP